MSPYSPLQSEVRHSPVANCHGEAGECPYYVFSLNAIACLPHCMLRSLRPVLSSPTVWRLFICSGSLSCRQGHSAARQAHLFCTHSPHVTITSVSLWMSRKGLITTNYLSPSFCQFVLYVLFIAKKKKKEKKKPQETVPVCIRWETSLSPIQTLPIAVAGCQQCTTDNCLWAQGSPLSLKHFISQRSVFPLRCTSY